MKTPSAADIGRVIKACRYSAKGLTAAWKNEAAFRQEVLLFLVLVPVALWLGHTMVQRAILILPLLTVLVVELINSAIETVVDRIGPEHHRLSGRAKDMGSAAVLLSLVAAAAAWLLVLLEQIGGS